jgi:hypothetical protein
MKLINSLVCFVTMMCCVFAISGLVAQSSTSPTPEYVFLNYPGETKVGSTLGTIHFRGMNANNQVIDGAMIRSIVNRPVNSKLFPTSLEILTGVDGLRSRFYIAEHGLIGLNTNKPTSLLSINQFANDLQIGKLFEVVGGSNSATKSFQIFSENNSLKTDYQGHFLMREGNMVLQDGFLNLDKGNLLVREGTLAIGTGNDALKGAHKLYVNGSIVATEMKIEYYQNWPDYVFKSGYEIDLDSIESFVKVNGHLPGIPSADEVSKHGFELGEMQKLLLEKIEELTLILIRHKNEIECLKNQIQDKQNKR